ncbi:MAG: carboxypeptidase-like regulatory domain-containing protein [Bacteroidales bacterium]|nr:carboxypeptidase-like regulatory domain-containing protein [Bacteroidales bacterium]
MRIRLLLALMLLPLFAYAQERYTVSGRIVNENGEAVEYVQVGIPKLGIGTVSSSDGRFEIKVPAERLEFHHVSYQIGYYTVTGPQNDVVIVLKENELPPAVVIGGKSKEKYLIRAGTRFPGAAGDFYRPDGVVKGIELGSVANPRKPFLIKDIQFTVTENNIPGCVASVNIYRIEGEPEEFINILHKPIYVNIALSKEKQQYNICPDDIIMLEPGRYYISFELVDCDMDAVHKYQQTPESERDPGAMHLYVAIYFKSSYQRNTALGELKHIPVNIGLVVKGLEFQ